MSKTTRPGGIAARYFVCLLTALLAAVLLSACGSGGSSPLTSTAPTPGATPTQTASAPASAAPAESPSVGTASRPTPAPPPISAAALAAAQAAAGFFSAVYLADAAACKAPIKTCVLRENERDSPDLGVASMTLQSPGEGAGKIIFGRQANGQWALWFSTQNDFYQALAFPAEMRVCADGQGANVRRDADEKTPTLGLIRDDTRVTADSFVLTLPGERAPSSKAGLGWYAVSAPTKGFIRSDLLSTTALPDCSVRNLRLK